MLLLQSKTTSGPYWQCSSDTAYFQGWSKIYFFFYLKNVIDCIILLFFSKWEWNNFISRLTSYWQKLVVASPVEALLTSFAILAPFVGHNFQQIEITSFHYHHPSSFSSSFCALSIKNSAFYLSAFCHFQLLPREEIVEIHSKVPFPFFFSVFSNI